MRYHLNNAAEPSPVLDVQDELQAGNLLLAAHLLARRNERRRGGGVEYAPWSEHSGGTLRGSSRPGAVVIFGFRANGTPAVPSRVLNISAIAMLII